METMAKLTLVQSICTALCLLIALFGVVKCGDDDNITKDEWSKTFKVIFKNSKTRARLSEAELASSMGLLQRAAEQLGNSVGDQEKKLVNKWYGYMTDKNPEHCSATRFAELAHEYNRVHKHESRNFEQVFFKAQKNLIAFCSQHHSDLVGIIKEKLGSKCEGDMQKLMEKYRAWKNSKEESALIRALRYQVYSVANVDKRLSKRRIISAWNDGPCGRVLEAVKSGELSSKADYISFVLGLSDPYRSFLDAKVWRSVEVIEMCSELTKMVPRFASYGSTGKNIARNVGGLVSKSSNSN